jgi:hypothetical protein
MSLNHFPEDSALETKAPFIVLNEGQAMYLIHLSRAANDYRSSWEALTKRGQDETDRLDKGQWVSGPNHQVMSEVEQEYGKIKMALDLVWSVFRVDIFAEEDREAARAEIDQFLKIAMGPSKGMHGTWFREGHTTVDFKAV